MEWYLISSGKTPDTKGLICLTDAKAKQMKKNKNLNLERVEIDIKPVADKP